MTCFPSSPVPFQNRHTPTNQHGSAQVPAKAKSPSNLWCTMLVVVKELHTWLSNHDVIRFIEHPIALMGVRAPGCCWTCSSKLTMPYLFLRLAKTRAVRGCVSVQRSVTLRGDNKTTKTISQTKGIGHVSNSALRP